MAELRAKKILKISLIIALIVIVAEGILFFVIKNNREKSNVYYDNYNETIMDQDNYVAVGSSYFKYSKKNRYTNNVEKGKLIKFDKDGNTLFEVQYDKGIASTFNSVSVTDDGYIVVGSGEYSDYQVENKIRDAFIIKYDKSGNKVWEKYYKVLSDTRFNKVINVSDGFVVVGTSIYEEMEVGNHTTGGGIIVKYDFDGNEIWHANHGGNKSGSFNGIVKVNNDYYVTGKDGADSGNIVKFDKDGKYVWHKNYSYTDGFGMKDITFFDGNLYIVGSKKILENKESEDRKTKNTDGLIIKYNLKGEKLNEYTFGGSSYERFTSVVSDDNNMYVLGISASTDMDLKIDLEKSDVTITSGIILKYDKDMKLVSSNVLGGTKNDQMLGLNIIKDNLIASGYSNSNNGSINTKENNGKDYFGKVIKLDTDLNITKIK